jgi:hypothetical protein
MLGFLLDAAVSVAALLFRGKRAQRYVPAIGVPLTAEDRRSLSREWREWASELRLTFEPGAEHVEGQLQGFEVDIRRRFAESLALRVVVHAKGFTAVTEPIAIARDNIADGSDTLKRLLNDLPALYDLRVEDGAVTFRLAPRASPSNVDACLARVAELARVHVGERGYR